MFQTGRSILKTYQSAIEVDDAVNVKILSKTPCRIALVYAQGKQTAGVADITWQGFVNETLGE